MINIGRVLADKLHGHFVVRLGQAIYKDIFAVQAANQRHVQGLFDLVSCA
jgi:hypothetical protein